MVVHLTYYQKIEGSNPAASTGNKKIVENIM